MNNTQTIIVYRSMREQALDQVLFSDAGAHILVFLFCAFISFLILSACQNKLERVRWLNGWIIAGMVLGCTILLTKLAIYLLTYL